MAAGNINLLSLDFDAQKQAFKEYLKNQDTFKDYDFDGSNMSVLLDILAYNTYINSFYTNMAASEMFIDTAQLRDNIVSHAKELNYLPRSFKSAEAVINLTVNTGNLDLTSLTMPKGTTFTSKIDNKPFTFATDSNIVLFGSGGVFTASGVSIFEGQYLTETYVLNNEVSNQRFVISNGTVDTSSISVTVVEDNGATVMQYTYATTLFNLNSDSKVYFLQAAENERYEIIFGDGVSGRKPKNGATIIVEYRTSSGELPNGAFKFSVDGAIDGFSNVQISTVTAAGGGAVGESTESIRFNAPRHFSTQERAVTATDYETLLKTNFPEIQAVSAYGGEEETPPQFGRVFISVDIKDVDGLPESRKTEYTRFISDRAPIAIEPVFKTPEDLNIYVESLVRYDATLTDLSTSDISTIVVSAIAAYNDSSLADFKKTLRYSRLVNAIDNSHPSIISNETKIKAIRKIQPIINSVNNYLIQFDQPLLRSLDITNPTIKSTSFFYNNINCVLVDNGNGQVNIVAENDQTGSPIFNIGNIDYDTGNINLLNFRVTGYSGTAIKIYAQIRTDDIFSIKNSIINIREDDLKITAVVSTGTPDNLPPSDLSSGT